MQSKVERAIDNLKDFLTFLDDVESRTNDVKRDFDNIRPSNYDCDEERDKLNEIIHLEEQDTLPWINMKQLEHSMVDLADLHKQCQFQTHFFSSWNVWFDWPISDRGVRDGYQRSLTYRGGIESD